MALLSPLKLDAWQKQQHQCFVLRKLQNESPTSVFGVEALQNAFAPLQKGDTLYVCCSDERCGSGYEPETKFHRFASPGTFVLRDESKGELDYAFTFLEGMKANGINIVAARHEGCGACGYKCKLDAEVGKQSKPDEVGELAARKVCDKVKAGKPQTMGYSPGCEVHMRGDAHFHDARKMLVDLSNTLTNPSMIGITPAFQLNRYTNDTQILIDDIKLLLSIAMDEHHGFGRGEFQKDKFIVLVVGVKDDKTFTSAAFTKQLTAALDDLTDAVEVIGMDV